MRTGGASRIRDGDRVPPEDRRATRSGTPPGYSSARQGRYSRPSCYAGGTGQVVSWRSLSYRRGSRDRSVWKRGRTGRSVPAQVSDTSRKLHGADAETASIGRVALTLRQALAGFPVETRLAAFSPRTETGQATSLQFFFYLLSFILQEPGRSSSRAAANRLPDPAVRESNGRIRPQRIPLSRLRGTPTESHRAILAPIPCRYSRPAECRLEFQC